MWRGQRALVKPFLLMAIGDTKEYNMMSCHFNSSGSQGIKCLCKNCMCSFGALGNRIPAQCIPITMADIEHAMEHEEYAQQILQH
mmetsp:Transcript_20919/g.35983  ORF Transcript_20919/g.35983 Transcript_20919/m.35983 type:complete len:85 (-) Transcript_20919:101-355(-)